jgi:hypothetical protein
MNTRMATFCCALALGLAATTIGCEARDRSIGTNGNNLKCQQLPTCQFPCPEGTVNPVDGDGCTHTCECVVPTGGTGMADAGTVTGDCSIVPQCDFLCPEGTINPVNASGCTETCRCVRRKDVCPNEPACGSACPPGTVNPTDRSGCITGCTCVPAPSMTTDAGVGGLKLFYTCGDPVCRGYTGGSGAPLCTTEKVGDSCAIDSQKCDPQDDCNALVICASSDPTMRPGGCPISRRRYKEDIHYLAPAELVRYRDEILAMKLATWRYKHDPSKQRLGFMIDDNEGSAAVNAQRDLVDLYGYTSMAVATIQLQAQQIEALEREVAEMRKALMRRSQTARK